MSIRMLLMLSLFLLTPLSLVSAQDESATDDAPAAVAKDAAAADDPVDTSPEPAKKEAAKKSKKKKAEAVEPVKKSDDSAAEDAPAAKNAGKMKADDDAKAPAKKKKNAKKPADEPAKSDTPSNEKPTAKKKEAAKETPAEGDKPAKQPAAAKKVSPEELKTAAAEYDRLFGEWKDLLAEMRGVQMQYKTVRPEQQAALREKYDEMIAKGESLKSDLMDAAEAKYLLEPDADPTVPQLLAEMANQELQHMHFEDAYRRSTTLIEAGHPNKALSELAAVAAFETGRSEESSKYFAQARDNNVLSAEGEIYSKEAKIRAAEAKANDLPRVKLTTSKGVIVLEMFEDQAPIAVTNFISLVQKGFYDGLTFHRVIDGFMAQGGDPNGTGTGGPGYTIPCECYRDDARLHFRGTLSMAHAGKDTGGSQFFLTFGRTSHLDHMHTVFGRVIEGLDVLDKLQRRDPSDAGGPAPDKIIKAEVIRKRDHKYDIEELLAKGNK